MISHEALLVTTLSYLWIGFFISCGFRVSCSQEHRASKGDSEQAIKFDGEKVASADMHVKAVGMVAL